jgi:ParB-like chromosome segregation protein Spo0J
MTDAEAFEAQLVENLHRRELTDYEKGRAFREALIRFKDRYPTQEALAKRLGKSQDWVSLQVKAYETAENLKRDAFTT